MKRTAAAAAALETDVSKSVRKREKSEVKAEKGKIEDAQLSYHR